VVSVTVAVVNRVPLATQPPRRLNAAPRTGRLNRSSPHAGTSSTSGRITFRLVRATVIVRSGSAPLAAKPIGRLNKFVLCRHTERCRPCGHRQGERNVALDATAR
jgi:hypothetical protein